MVRWMKNKWNRREKLFFSKLLVVASVAVFLYVLKTVFALPAEETAYQIVTVYATAITASGAMAVTAIVWYLKKTQTGYTNRIQRDTYKAMANIDIEYERKMLKLKRQYQASDQEIEEIKRKSQIDDFSRSQAQKIKSTMDTAESDATSLVTRQSAQ